MRRSQSVLDVKNDNYNLENNEEGSKTAKLSQMDINRIYGNNSFSRKLKKIEDELSQFDPDTLMLKVDPTKNITKTIKQIQLYYNNIKCEINKYISQEKLEASLKKKISKIPKQIELLVHPPKVATIQQNEIPPTINAKGKSSENVGETGKDLQSHYRETSEGGLAKKYCRNKYYNKEMNE